MKPTTLHTAIAGILAVASTGAQAAMPPDAILDFTGNFSMDVGGATGLVNTPFKTGPDGGIILGVTQDTNGHASHGGTKSHLQGGLDYEWNFFNNQGMHFTATPISVINEDVNSDGGTTKTLDFSGWRVTWNGIPSINMGGGVQDCGTSTDGICVNASSVDIAGTYDNGTGIATIVCNPADCQYGSTFTLTYNAVVPQADPSNFGGVNYGVNITGTILNPAGAPISAADTASTITDNPVIINVIANDTQNPDPTLVTVSNPLNGTAFDNNDGTVTFTPTASFTGTGSFDYTVANINGTSATAAVTVTITANTAPVATDDTASISTAVLDNTGSLSINVLANDTDSNNSNDLPGGIETTSVTIVTDATTGNCTANSDGTITYTQPSAAVGVVDTCTYRISDIDSSGTPLTDTATVTITVTQLTSDWPTSLAPDIIPVLAFDPGVANSTDQSLAPTSGSYFTMQLSATRLIYTTIEPGPDGGMIIGHEQPASGSHTGAPNGTEHPGFTAPWSFFSNTGFDLTRNGGIEANPDGTLNFDTRYVVTWNGIPVINLGGSSQFAEDLGYATITCTPAPCADQSSFVLDYAAHVEDVAGQPASGFNGVPYTLHLAGTVRFLDGSAQTSSGTVSTLTRQSAGDVTDDSGVAVQCVGGCFDYTVTGVATSRINLVLPLAGGVRDNSVWRILDNGTWRNFDTSTGDSIKSAAFVAGASGMECPAPGDAAYHDLTEGDQCIQLAISDNGPNDLNSAVGTISDPSGLGAGGSAGGGTTFVDTRTSSTSGCSILGGEGDLRQRGEWLILAGFIAWLGWNRSKRAAS